MNIDNKLEQQKKDADLLALVCKGDEKAFELLYQRFYDRLTRFITRTMHRTDRVDEIINDVMYVVWEKAGSYDRRCQVSTWIFGIAFNKVRQSLRDSSYPLEQPLEDLEGDSIFLAAKEDAPADIEMHNWLDHALASLSADHRAVIELTYYQGLHYSEIAELMNCTENTVKTRMHYARKKLVKFLS